MMKRNLLLLAGVVLLGVIPFFIYQPKEGEEPFVGADSKAEELVPELENGPKPWYSNLWEPPSAEVESMLFAVQAAIGAGIVCYVIGYYRGRHMERKKKEGPADASG